MAWMIKVIIKFQLIAYCWTYDMIFEYQECAYGETKTVQVWDHISTRIYPYSNENTSKHWVLPY